MLIKKIKLLTGVVARKTNAKQILNYKKVVQAVISEKNRLPVGRSNLYDGEGLLFLFM